MSVDKDYPSNSLINHEVDTNTSNRKWFNCQNTKRAKLTEEQKWRSLSIVFIILDVLLLIITLTIVVVWVKDRENRPVIQQTSTFCLPREEVSLHKDDDAENFKHFENKTENGKEILCTETDKHLDSLVNLYVERKYRIERAHEPIYSYCDGYTDSIRKPAARVVDAEHSVSAKDNTNTYIAHWDAAAPHSFVNNITYKNGRFAIVQKGYYYVYSQVTFKESNITDTPYTALCHFIFRIKPNGNGEYAEKLLESSQTKCQLQSQTSNSTSYIGAVFYLRENDKVQVRVTHPDKITKSSYSNYFGLHMI